MVTLIPISDILDEAAGRRLQTTMRKHVAQGSVLHVFDMRDLTQLDACAIGALIRALRVVREAGGSISLVADQPNVLTTLSLTALDRVFRVYRNERDALAALEAIRAIPA